MFSLHIKINFFIIASRYTRCRGALLIFGAFYMELPVTFLFPASLFVPYQTDV